MTSDTHMRSRHDVRHHDVESLTWCPWTSRSSCADQTKLDFGASEMFTRHGRTRTTAPEAVDAVNRKMSQRSGLFVVIRWRTPGDKIALRSRWLEYGELFFLCWFQTPTTRRDSKWSPSSRLGRRGANQPLPPSCASLLCKYRHRRR
jgi:hypothetical protein